MQQSRTLAVTHAAAQRNALDNIAANHEPTPACHSAPRRAAFMERITMKLRSSQADVSRQCAGHLTSGTDGCQLAIVGQFGHSLEVGNLLRLKCFSQSWLERRLVQLLRARPNL